MKQIFNFPSCQQTFIYYHNCLLLIIIANVTYYIRILYDKNMTITTAKRI